MQVNFKFISFQVQDIRIIAAIQFHQAKIFASSLVVLMPVTDAGSCPYMTLETPTLLKVLDLLDEYFGTTKSFNAT